MNQEEQRHMNYTEIAGFNVGDKVRLCDGDGRTHIIKSFELVGIRTDSYIVHFEDNAATGLLSEDYTDMVKIEKEDEL